MMVNNTVIETFSTQSVLNLKKFEDPAQLLPSTALASAALAPRRTGPGPTRDG